MLQLAQKNPDLERYIYLVNCARSQRDTFLPNGHVGPRAFCPSCTHPTIGEACLKFGHIYRQPRGMYLSIERRGKVKDVLQNWPRKDVRFHCVTRCGRILDWEIWGANGMGIPMVSAAVHRLAGVPPQYLLPMYLDAGTNNENTSTILYSVCGSLARQPSSSFFVDEFVEAVQELFPKCCIHFEDWTGRADAVHLLQLTAEVCVYNDDVQGTAGIVLAGDDQCGQDQGRS